MSKVKLNGSAYHALLAEAAAAAQACIEINRPENWRLTADAYAREALSAAGTTPARLDWLEKELAARPELGVLRKFEIAIRGPNYPTVPREARRISHLLTLAEEAALLALGSGCMEAFALSAVRLAKTNPATFGRCENLREQEQRLLALTLRRDELFARLEREYSGEDIDLGKPDGQGNARASLKVSGGAVPLGPNLGERAVAWFLSQPNGRDGG
jgi:hypothetical protein